MKFRRVRPFADPNLAAHKLVEIANGFEAVMDGSICIERINPPVLAAGGTDDDFHAGTERAVALGW